MTQSDGTNLGLISALIVDDNAFDRRRLKRFAQETGLDFLLKEVSTVEEFARILDQEKFDVVFVDLNLAGANGMTLLGPVRSHRVNRDAAMIMVAGNNQAGVALQAIRAGFADYIEKEELSESSLERATVNALQKRRLSKAADSAHEETRSVEGVLRTFSDMCSGEMRPLMVRMMRQVRQMRPRAEAMGMLENIAEIESTCARMDEFFRDLGSLAEDGELARILTSEAPTAKDIRTAPPVAPQPERPRQIIPEPAAPAAAPAASRQRLFKRSSA